MKTLWGKLITPGRLRLLDEYKRRRFKLTNSPRLSRREYDAATAWVRDFERFMCEGWDPELKVYGIEEPTADAQSHDPGLPPTYSGLDGRGYALDARSRVEDVRGMDGRLSLRAADVHQEATAAQRAGGAADNRHNYRGGNRRRQ